MTRKSVMDKIKKENDVFSIKILGNRKDQADAFYILMNTQHLISDEKNIFHGIKNSTLELLEKAEIKFVKLNQKGVSQEPRNKKGWGRSYGY